MDDSTLLRYNRQIMMPSLGIEGQQKIMDSTVFVVGLGGLGSPVAMYLASSGVGHLVLNDFDDVDLSNLQRADRTLDPVRRRGQGRFGDSNAERT